MAAGQRKTQRNRTGPGAGNDPAIRPAPNPAYVAEPPREVVINGKRCVNTDAASILALAEHYRIFKVK